MKVYLFFIYVKPEDIYHYPLVRRYHSTDKQYEVDGYLRYFYAYTKDKVLKDIFMEERNMKLFGKYPSIIHMDVEEMEKFELAFLGRELERRGIEGTELLPHGGIGNLVGTGDEFSYATYDYFDDISCSSWYQDLPPSSIFAEEYREALIDLHYPIESIFDGFESIGDMDNDIYDKYAIYANSFGNLYKVGKKI